MSNSLDEELRATLRPLAPSDDFSRQLIARVTAAQGAEPLAPARTRRRSKQAARWLSASLAAAMLLAIGARNHFEQQRVREDGLEARREVLQALRMTSQKLNLAYETVKSQSASISDENSGV